MFIFCIGCWLVMIADALCMRFFHDEIKARPWLKATVVYLWLASVLLGIVSGVSVIIQEVSAWR